MTDEEQTEGMEAIGMGDLAAVKDVPMSESLMIATVALNMSLRWHDMGMIKDGVLYQQKKMEGANINYIDKSDIIKTAEEFEAYFLAAPLRHARMLEERIVDKFVGIMGEFVVEGLGRLAEEKDKGND